MEYLFFPGCSLEFTARGYERSARAVADALGCHLRDLPDWNCCGATSYMSIRELTSHALSSRNLALAEAEGAKDLVTVCSACYTVLNKTNDYMAEMPEFAQKIRSALSSAGLEYNGTVRVRHLLDVIVNDIGLDAVREKVVNPLDGLRVACYYGCQLTRPHGRFDDPEDPQTLEELVSALGATPVHYPLKAKCCGAMVVSTGGDDLLNLVDALLASAKDAGADCIVTPCQLCHFNLEFYQEDIKRKLKRDYRFPIYYFTQLVGLALGIPAGKLGFGLELIPSQKLVSSYART